MMEFAFEGTIQGGKLELEFKHVPFEPTDPKNRRDYLRLVRSD
jgi:hypothetical protein